MLPLQTALAPGIFPRVLAIGNNGRDARPVRSFLRQLAESAGAFRAVSRNPNLRRLQLGGAGAQIGGWAYAIAVSVYAYRAGGATAVGIVWLIRTVPAALVSPFAGILADRLRRNLVMLASDLLRAGLLVAAAVSVWLHGPPGLVYALAALVAILRTPFDPAQSALIPALSQTPEELTAANVAASAIESVAFFAGPAIAGILLGFTSVQVVFVVTAATFVWSALLISRLSVPEEALVAGAAGAADEAEQAYAHSLAGFAVLARDPRLRLLVGLLAATSVIVGAIEVLSVSTALELLHIGQSGVGYLNSAFGVGALLGAFVAVGFVGLRRLSVPFLAGALLWGVPVVLIGATANTVVTVVCLGLLGVGNTLVDVAGFTLVQRAVPDAVLARVFGVVQFLWTAAIGIGAVVAPALISGIGIRATLIATGCVLPALLVVFGPPLVRIDTAATAPAADRLALLRRSPIFAPLPGATLEHLAARLIPVEVEPGTVVIREGDPGDRFYLVAGGQVEVTSDGAHVATLGPGEYVGEIALLRDVPRTATVTAVSPVALFALERDDFLLAVNGSTASRSAAETLASRRLTGLAGATGRVPVPNL